MDYQKIADDILFGREILNNAVRGEYIEAVVHDAPRQHNADQALTRWYHIGPTPLGPVGKLSLEIIRMRKGFCFAELPRAMNDGADAFLGDGSVACVS